jgi:hypothetical protein
MFLEDSEVVAACQGVRVYLGECLGKHSEVVVEIGDNVELVTEDPVHIGVLTQHGACCGINPFERLRDRFWDEPESHEGTSYGEIFKKEEEARYAISHALETIGGDPFFDTKKTIPLDDDFDDELLPTPQACGLEECESCQ